MKYIKKSIEIEALIFDGSNYKECRDFVGMENIDNTLGYPNVITSEGVMHVNVGDYIIKEPFDKKRGYYPCKPDIFKKTYYTEKECAELNSKKTMTMFELKNKSFDKDSLQTPQFIFDWLNEKYKFYVDLAATGKNAFCNAWSSDSLDDDWSKIWPRRGFCNPPYSKIDLWIEKAILEADKGFTSVFIIPDFSDEERFESIAKHATTIIHLIGIVSFINPNDGNEYKDDNRGLVIIEFSKKYFDTQPKHLYFKRRDIESEYG